MDWSRAKTILIMTFIFLNAFLIFQLVEKRNAENMSVMAQEDHSFQELLRRQNIEISIDDPEADEEGQYISGEGHEFGDEEQSMIEEQFEDQEISFRRNQMIRAVLDEPQELFGLDMASSVESFLADHLYNGDEYRFASYDEEERMIRAFQVYEDEPLRYRGEESHVILYLTEDGEVEGYDQRYMDFSPQLAPELMTPLEAIEVLILEYGIADVVIDEVELGHYNMTPANMDAHEYYAPMWRVTVDDEYYFVNAHNSEVWTD
ncbi:hypothetical protein CR205_17865 [Alteribacter lacisalsi]|uniref:Regulatory protein YycH-like domain-containing protein n=1 Tax=Alteribacter lacisalsi TaxID=2045244 RepID=A0A2W0H6B2_9BACI|nr:two-component system regulatory protein YycI [Alteribacter lacisalsi]PYZ96226.1 hypothetical protein CR205_17865 [Alteribacter lacisalsi]